MAGDGWIGGGGDWATAHEEGEQACEESRALKAIRFGL